MTQTIDGNGGGEQASRGTRPDTFAPLSEDAAAVEPRRIPVTVDGALVEAREGRPLLEALTDTTQSAERFPDVCYHPALGPIQTCDTCMVEVDGEVVRSCAIPAAEGLEVVTTGAAADAREQAAQRLVRKHTLYCTICDHNDGDCTLKKGIEATGLLHETIGFSPKPYEVDDSHPFYRYDPDQCILCGRCVEACQDVQVTETLSIDWSATDPRVLWDGGVAGGGVVLRVLRSLRLGVPVQRPDGEVDAGPPRSDDRLARRDPQPGHRPGQGRRADDRLRPALRDLQGRGVRPDGRHRHDQDGVHLLRGRLLLRRRDPGARDPADPAAARGPGQLDLHLRQGQVRLGPHQRRGPAHPAARARR